MVGCCLLLSTALFVVAHRPVIVNYGLSFVTLWSQRGHRCCCRRGWLRGPVGGYEAVTEDQLVLQR
jgi:hypothetical protein